MENYKKYFKGKKITVMGLGLLGRGLGYTKFLAECGADLIVTDLKSKEQLKNSLKDLKKLPKQGFGKIKFVLGEHRLEDFENRDIIMKMPGVPKNSIYLKRAKETGASIEMDVSLFAKLAPEVMIIGVTGTRGKSMTTALIYEILKENVKFIKDPSSKALRTKTPKVFLGGNVRGVATLPLLKKVDLSAGGVNILVCELDSWQLQGFGPTSPRLRGISDAGISPHISVFTSFMPDHMNYYGSTTLTTGQAMQAYFEDKANIFKNQKVGDFLITDTKVKSLMREMPKSQIILADKRAVADFDFIVPGEHQRQNLAYAVAVAEILGIPKNAIRKTVKKFKGVEGRLQLLRIYKGIKIYNDNNATTPEATIAGIEALKKNPQVGPVENHRNHRSDLWEKNIVLICGGADKNLSLENLTKEINKSCKFVSFIPGTGTDLLINNYELQIKNKIAKDFKDAVKEAMKQAKKGDIVLFSPAFASFGLFNNEYERNDEFVKTIKGLK